MLIFPLGTLLRDYKSQETINYKLAIVYRFYSDGNPVTNKTRDPPFFVCLLISIWLRQAIYQAIYQWGHFNTTLASSIKTSTIASLECFLDFSKSIRNLWVNVISNWYFS